MKPTSEQINDPKWWDKNAPYDATHYKKADFFENCGWYNFNRKPAEFMFFGDSEGKWLNTTSTKDDVFSIIAERPSHAAEADAKPVPAGQKHDSGKPMMGLIPPRAELAVAEVLTFGAAKYGPDNWRDVPDADRRYMDAAKRHINAYQRFESLDQESGLPHLAHAICCLMFMLDMEPDIDAPTR